LGAKAQTNAIQAAMLGLLALLLCFTFTMALQRFDSRSQAVLNEANAIGTAYLRTQLLPEAQRERAKEMIADYVQLRVDASTVDLTQEEPRCWATRAASRAGGRCLPRCPCRC